MKKNYRVKYSHKNKRLSIYELYNYGWWVLNFHISIFNVNNINVL